MKFIRNSISKVLTVPAVVFLAIAGAFASAAVYVKYEETEEYTIDTLVKEYNTNMGHTIQSNEELFQLRRTVMNLMMEKLGTVYSFELDSFGRIELLDDSPAF